MSIPRSSGLCDIERIHLATSSLIESVNKADSQSVRETRAEHAPCFNNLWARTAADSGLSKQNILTSGQHGLFRISQ